MPVDEAADSGPDDGAGDRHHRRGDAGARVEAVDVARSDEEGHVHHRVGELDDDPAEEEAGDMQTAEEGRVCVQPPSFTRGHSTL